MNHIKDKIRALLSKTVEAGCTEAEAFAALEKARALMDAYEISPEELELTKAEKAEIVATDLNDPHNVKACLAVAIAEFCDCKVWRDREEKVRRFCGLRSDADLAIWMLDSLSQFVLNELAVHLIRNPCPPQMKRRVINGFVYGATSRINHRLRELKRQSQQAQTGNGRALVVTKNALIKEAMKGIHLRSSRSSRVLDDGAYQDGRAAGDRAIFARPVSGHGAVLRLS